MTQRVLEYERVMRGLVPSIESPADWAPLEDLVAIEGFERTGVFMEVQDWSQYKTMLTGWARSIDSFESTLQRVTEYDRLVFYEIEEHHHRGDVVNVVNTMTVFEFDEVGKIRRLRVYLQQPAPHA
ncbi:MAG TPA: hypothetical protein VEJ44_05510 [Acidimicrobiales bacterium]|nr:hypothetical protein [Acidimicrobiales bacterium]